MKEHVLFEGEDFLVVNKPAGVLSQKDRSGEWDLADFLQHDYEKLGAPKPFLAPVHRLDRNTSGLILLATSSKGAQKLTQMIQSGNLHRTYLALVKGNPGESGEFHFPLKKNTKSNEVYVDPNGVEALTEFRNIQKLGNSSLVEVRLHSGKSHQIRVHFSHAGHALLGDKKYAKKPWSEIFARPALHSWHIHFSPDSPYGEKNFEAPLPNDIHSLLLTLGGKWARDK